ncbi:MAG: 4Fe-4S dicluster domain-containing protein [Thermofilaceae archaeon]
MVLEGLNMGLRAQAQVESVEAGAPKMIRIYVMGRRYLVPEGLTILKALEYAGFRLVRGVGCRGGFCGACATLYRKPGEYRLKIALACQNTVEDEMHIVMLPYTPIPKTRYRLENLKLDAGLVFKLFPEIARCVACNTCTKGCPQGLQVMDAVQAVKRGDLARASNLTFDCIACGICATRCPAEIRHPEIFLLVRRLYGKFALPRSRHLEERLKEIAQGKYIVELEKLKKMPVDELKKLYASRTIEPEE